MPDTKCPTHIINSWSPHDDPTCSDLFSQFYRQENGSTEGLPSSAKAMWLDLPGTLSYSPSGDRATGGHPGTTQSMRAAGQGLTRELRDVPHSSTFPTSLLLHSADTLFSSVEEIVILISGFPRNPLHFRGSPALTA